MLRERQFQKFRQPTQLCYPRNLSTSQSCPSHHPTTVLVMSPKSCLINTSFFFSSKISWAATHKNRGMNPITVWYSSFSEGSTVLVKVKVVKPACLWNWYCSLLWLIFLILPSSSLRKKVENRTRGKRELLCVVTSQNCSLICNWLFAHFRSTFEKSLIDSHFC